MKLWNLGIFLLLVIQEPAVLQSQHVESNEKQTLRCYTCFVETSWEDCDKNRTVEWCPEGDAEICVTVTLRKWKNSKAVTQYTKHCAAADYCSQIDKECKKYNWDCTFDCCNKDLCNTSTTILANTILPAIILCLLVVIC